MKKFLSLAVLITLLALSFPVNAAFNSVDVFENFEDMNLSVSVRTDDVSTQITAAPDDGSRSGWKTYFKTSSNEYGSLATEFDSNTNNKILKIRRNISSTAQPVYMGYYNADGWTSDVTIDAKVRIEPEKAADTGNYYQKSIIIYSDYGTASIVNITFTNEENGAERTPIVTCNGVKIPDLSPENNVWQNIRLVFNQNTKTFNFYISENAITASTVPALSDAGFNAGVIKLIQFQVYRDGAAAVLKGGGNIYIDDLKVIGSNYENLWSFGSKETGSDDFENYINYAETGWTANVGAGGSTNSGNTAYESDTNMINKVIKLTRRQGAKSGNTYSVRHFKTYSDGLPVRNDGTTVANLRFKFKEETAGKAKHLYFISLNDGTVDNPLNTQGAYLIVENGKICLPDNSGETRTTDFPKISQLEGSPALLTGKWYYAKFVVNFNTGMYDIYVSDTLITDETLPIASVPLYTNSAVNSAVNIKRINAYIYSDADATYNYGTLSIDDIVINPAVSDTVYNTITFTGDKNNNGLARNTRINTFVNLETINYNTGLAPIVDMENNIILALFDSDEKLVTLSFEKGMQYGTDKLYHFIDLPSEITDYTDYKLKAFVWESTDGLKPLGICDEF